MDAPGTGGLQSFSMFRLSPLILVLILIGSAAAAPPAQELVRAQLLANTTAVKPGQSFTIGVLLKIEPRWHVYWLNPGDSGRATTVKFTMPKGFKVGAVQYPVPLKFDQLADVIGYGYENEVLITADVKTPFELKDISEIAIAADVQWLSCRDACVPGKASVSVKLPVSEKPSKANEKLFAEWAERFPRGKHPDVDLGEWEVDPRSGTSVARVSWTGQAPAKVELYPGKDEAVEVGHATVLTSGTESLVRVKAQIINGEKPASDTLPALIVYTDDKGVRRGINLSVPVGKAATSAGP